VGIEFRWARGADDQLPALVTELVNHRGRWRPFGAGHLGRGVLPA
jgi:hypothetical protein